MPNPKRRLFTVSIFCQGYGKITHDAGWLWGEDQADVEAVVRQIAEQYHQASTSYPAPHIVVKPTPLTVTVGDEDYWAEFTLDEPQPEFGALAQAFRAMGGK